MPVGCGQPVVAAVQVPYVDLQLVLVGEVVVEVECREKIAF